MPGREPKPEPREAKMDELLRLHDRGEFPADPTPLPPLPERVPRAVRTVAAFYAKVHGVHYEGVLQGAPLFCASWGSPSHRPDKQTAWREINRLADLGVIHKPGSTRSRTQG